MRHPAAWGLLPAYLDGELSSAQRVQLETHLEACASCRGELASLKRLAERARQLPDALDPSRDLWPGILAAIGTPTAPEPAGPRTIADRVQTLLRSLWASRQLRLGAAGGALAAAVLLVILTEVHRAPTGGGPAAGGSATVATDRGPLDPEAAGVLAIARLTWLSSPWTALEKASGLA